MEMAEPLPLEEEEEEEEAMGMVEMAEPMLLAGQLAELELVAVAVVETGVPEQRVE